MIKSSYPEDQDEDKPILRLDCVVLFPTGIFPVDYRRGFYELSETKTYWMFPPIGAWRHVLMKRIKQSRFVLLLCPHMINHEELAKYGLQGKHVLYFCTSKLINTRIEDAHDLIEFERWYCREIDYDGGYYCTEDKITSFRLLRCATSHFDINDFPESYGSFEYRRYSLRKDQTISNDFRYCSAIKNILYLSRWPEAKTLIVMKTRAFELAQGPGKTRTEVMTETTNSELGFFRDTVAKKTEMYINKKGHFSVHNAGRWYPEGEMLIFDGKVLSSLLTGEMVTSSPRMFFQNGCWLRVLALDISLLEHWLVQMFDKIIFLDHRKHLGYTSSDEYVLRRCAKSVIVFSYKDREE